MMSIFQKFITKEYDILTNINDIILTSENFAMLYDLLYKKNNDSHMPDDSVLSGNKDDVIQFFERTLQLIQN